MPTALFASALVVAALALAPAQHQHQASHDRANQGMGFDQDKTTHHFLLQKAGGTIEVTARDAADSASIDQIRMHLQHIATAFGSGDFAIPMFVHDPNPPGIAVMKDRRAEMTFRYESLDKGGKVVAQTADPAALAALHDFLRFQIREHKTGDPLTPR